MKFAAQSGWCLKYGVQHRKEAPSDVSRMFFHVMRLLSLYVEVAVWHPLCGHFAQQHPLGWMRVQNPTMSVSNLVWSCLLVSCWFLLVSLVTSYPHTSPCVLLKFTGFSRFYDRYQDWQGSNCLNSIGGQTIQKHDYFAFSKRNAFPFLGVLQPMRKFLLD